MSSIGYANELDVPTAAGIPIREPISIFSANSYKERNEKISEGHWLTLRELIIDVAFTDSQRWEMKKLSLFGDVHPNPVELRPREKHIASGY